MTIMLDVVCLGLAAQPLEPAARSRIDNYYRSVKSKEKRDAVKIARLAKARLDIRRQHGEHITKEEMPVQT